MLWNALILRARYDRPLRETLAAYVDVFNETLTQIHPNGAGRSIRVRTRWDPRIDSFDAEARLHLT